MFRRTKCYYSLCQAHTLLTSAQRLKRETLTISFMSFKRRDLFIKSVCCNFIKIYQEIKNLYAFEVSIISFMEALIFVCL